MVTVDTVIANAGDDVDVCSGTCTTLNGSASGSNPGYTYSWNPTTGLDDPDTANPEACPDMTTTYTLTVTDNNGCTDIDQVRITINPCLPQLSLTKSSEPQGNPDCTRTILRGETITYSLNYTNSGDAAAGNLIVIDHLDQGLTVVDVGTAAYDIGSHTLTWNVGQLNPGTSDVFSFVVRVIADSGTCIKNYARIWADNADTFTSDTIAHYVIGQPNILVSPTDYDFGSVKIGSTSPAQIFTISNEGDRDLVVGMLSITGANPLEFAIQNDNCSGDTLTPQNTRTFDLVFCPTSEGTKKANLSIPSNDPDSPTLNVILTGFGSFATKELIIFNYPNPARGNKTTFAFYSSDPSGVIIEVYDLAYESVETLKGYDRINGGFYERDWDIGDMAGGVYLYLFKDGGKRKIGKAMVVK